MKVYTNLLKDFESGYLGFAPITMMVQTCLGSIAVMYLLMDNSQTTIIELGLCIFASMGYNATVLGQLSKKAVFNALIVSVLINVIIFLMNVL